MSSDMKLSRLVEEVDFLLAEQSHFRERGIHIIVEHHDHEPGTICAPGEIIGDILLGGMRPRSFGFSETSLILVDCLFRYRMPLSAEKIEEIMQTDPFYVEYGANRFGCGQCVALPDRRTVRTYLRRIQKRMGLILNESSIAIDERRILTCNNTESHTTLYKMRATLSTVHVSLRRELLRQKRATRMRPAETADSCTRNAATVICSPAFGKGA